MTKFKKIVGIIYSLRRIKSFMRFIVGSIAWFSKNELLQIANSFSTDKGFPGHGYTRVYDTFLRDKRLEVKNFCEIGLLRHKLQADNKKEIYGEAPSLRMWRKYFPNANIIGFDIQAFKQPKDKQSYIIKGDQKSREDLKNIVKKQATFDLIIDDALHASEHQQVSFSFLFPYLVSGGLYVIEDLQYQPQSFERDNIPKTITLLKHLRDTGVWDSPVATKEEKRALESQVQDIYFFDSLKGSDAIKSADAIAVIVKK